jgi:hypothetical protein
LGAERLGKPLQSDSYLRRARTPARHAVAVFSAAHGLARRTRSFFKRHPRLAVCVQAPIVLAWFAPLVALAVKGWNGLFPGISGTRDIVHDVRGAWLLVLLAAAAACLGLLGNEPIAELVTEPEEELDLGSVALVLGMAVGPPIVLALWLSNVL